MLTGYGGQGGGEPFTGAEQVIKVSGQVREVGNVGAEVVTADAAEPERAGLPPAATLDGSRQIPNGTDTSPTTRRAYSESSKVCADAQILRVPKTSSAQVRADV